jgi:hypothetical protein
MRISLSLFLYNTHAAFSARVGASTLTTLMVDYVHTLYFYTAVNTWDKYVRTHGLMLFNVPSYTLLFALGECLTFRGSELANCIVVLNFFIR